MPRPSPIPARPGPSPSGLASSGPAASSSWRSAFGLLQGSHPDHAALQLPLGCLDEGILLRCQRPLDGRRLAGRARRGLQPQIELRPLAEPGPDQRLYLADVLARHLVVEAI